jgi:hypothetical protein
LIYEPGRLLAFVLVGLGRSGRVWAVWALKKTWGSCFVCFLISFAWSYVSSDDEAYGDKEELPYGFHKALPSFEFSPEPRGFLIGQCIIIHHIKKLRIIEIRISDQGLSLVLGNFSSAGQSLFVLWFRRSISFPGGTCFFSPFESRLGSCEWRCAPP